MSARDFSRRGALYRFAKRALRDDHQDMAHRDEWLALQARIEAQAREIDEAKSEIELLRAAHARKTHEAEDLRREVAALRGSSGAPPDPPFDPRPLRRAFAAAAGVLAGTALLAAALSIAGGRPVPRSSRRPSAAGVHVGHVVESPAGLFAAGDACTVTVATVRADPYDCRVEVRCGEHTIYGTTRDTGYVQCGSRRVIRDGNMTARDGDPAMTLDLDGHRVVVEEQDGLVTQRVEIELAPRAG
jgi:hypothetical protein